MISGFSDSCWSFCSTKCFNCSASSSPQFVPGSCFLNAVLFPSYPTGPVSVALFLAVPRPCGLNSQCSLPTRYLRIPSTFLSGEYTCLSPTGSYSSSSSHLPHQTHFSFPPDYCVYHSLFHCPRHHSISFMVPTIQLDGSVDSPSMKFLTSALLWLRC